MDGQKLHGAVAIVTGSSSGIGEETARRLSDLGATVVVNSSSSTEAGMAIADFFRPSRCTSRQTSAIKHRDRI